MGEVEIQFLVGLLLSYDMVIFIDLVSISFNTILFSILSNFSLQFLFHFIFSYCKRIVNHFRFHLKNNTGLPAC